MPDTYKVTVGPDRKVTIDAVVSGYPKIKFSGSYNYADKFIHQLNSAINTIPTLDYALKSLTKIGTGVGIDLDLYYDTDYEYGSSTSDKME